MILYKGLICVPESYPLVRQTVVDMTPGNASSSPDGTIPSFRGAMAVALKDLVSLVG